MCICHVVKSLGQRSGAAVLHTYISYFLFAPAFLFHFIPCLFLFQFFFENGSISQSLAVGHALHTRSLCSMSLK